MRRFENLLIVFIILILAMGFWLFYYSHKVDYNYSISKMLVDRDRANIELIGAIQDRLDRMEEKYSNLGREEI